MRETLMPQQCCSQLNPFRDLTPQLHTTFFQGANHGTAQISVLEIGHCDPNGKEQGFSLIIENAQQALIPA